VLRRYKPDTVEDLTALNALYRPGPMDMIDDFVERKWGRRKVEFLLPPLEEILKDSYGVIVYQEQVMRIANVLASYSLGEADILRRAMGKKDPKAMAEQRNRFITGAAKLGHPKAAVDEIFEQMAKFSGYGFNKSHSAAYALVAYQTAYLKTHYPVEFMAALLTSETSKPDSIVKYIGECREMGIRVEPPDVQVSGAQFTPHTIEDRQAVRFGLAAVKNVGGNAIESILKARVEAGEIGDPEMLVITSRDPGAPPIEYIKHSGGIFKDMLIHDFDVFRWMLDDEADTLHATGSSLSDPAIAAAGDIDSTAVTIRTKRGRLCQINTARRAAYGYDQRFELLGSLGMLQAGNVRPTQVTAYSRTAVSSDVPEAFFLERYRTAYALEIAHFFEAVQDGKPVRTTVADGLKALELADAATRSWREGRIIKLGAA